MYNSEGLLEGLFDIFNLSQEERERILKESEIVSATTDKEFVEKILNACDEEEFLRDVVDYLVEEGKAILEETATGWSIKIGDYVVMVKPRTVKEFPVIHSIGVEVQVWRNGKQLSIAER